MKTVLVLSFVIAVALAIDLPLEEVQFLAKVHSTCQDHPRTHCDESKLKDLVNNVNDLQVAAHMNCMAVMSGLQNPDNGGDFNIPNMKIKIGLVVEPNRVDEIIQKCAIKAESPGMSANLMYVCFIQNGVDYYYKIL